MLNFYPKMCHAKRIHFSHSLEETNIYLNCKGFMLVFNKQKNKNTMLIQTIN